MWSRKLLIIGLIIFHLLPQGKKWNFLLFLCSPSWLYCCSTISLCVSILIFLFLSNPPPPSSLMTVSRADRQIYLYRWQGRKKSSAKPCPASRLRQAWLWGNPGQLAPPRAGHIPLCCPWPCSELSARWDQSFTSPQTNTLPHQPRGEREQRRQEERAAAQRADGCS